MRVVLIQRFQEFNHAIAHVAVVRKIPTGGYLPVPVDGQTGARGEILRVEGEQALVFFDEELIFGGVIRLRTSYVPLYALCSEREWDRTHPEEQP